MTTTYAPQTTAATMARIDAGGDPWIAFRDFLEDWTYLPEARAELIAARPPVRAPRDRRWAALLAASVEALCERDGVPVPAWTADPSLSLRRPWYLYDGRGRIRDWLRASTPAVFAKRNIWSGDKILRRT
jgi:hypothetical protein